MKPQQVCWSFLVLSFVTNQISNASAFAPQYQHRPSSLATPSTSLRLFNKLFEESGLLGKGITVGKVQVALASQDRSIFTTLEETARDTAGTSNLRLARLCNQVALALLRKSNDWIAACSESKWFSQSDSGQAESCFNDWVNREAAKFEKVQQVAVESVFMINAYAHLNQCFNSFY
jgi:hypothetical protein